MAPLTGSEIATAGLTDWANLRNCLMTRLATGNFAAGLRLVARIGEVAESADHHPDLDLRYGHLDVRLTSHDVGGVTERDIAVARLISQIAAEEEVSADPSAVKLVEVALDTPDAALVRPFWRELLGMREVPAGDSEIDLADDVLPSMWFQPSGSQEPRQRFHFDLWVAPELVPERIEAALAAGGVLVSDAEAPSFWVLADPDGNRVCLCTWQERSST